MIDQSGPIILDFKSAQATANAAKPASLRTFDSYNFERNILIPGSAFRFTAPGVDAKLRQSIRSGDFVELFCVAPDGTKSQLATGIIDETDTHVMPSRVEYVLTGRDMLGQMIDNAVVDKNNRVIQTTNITLEGILQQLIANTRISQQYIKQQLPNGQLLFQTNPGETKISALQRYLDFTNTVVWCAPNGQIKIGKPNMAQKPSDNAGLVVNNINPSTTNNVLEARVRRSTNLAIRQIVTQLQTLNNVPPTQTVFNQDKDMQAVAAAGVGRSVFDVFSYGQGNDTVNQLTAVGNSNGNPYSIGLSKSLRELAKDNMKILDVECVVRGHLNANNQVYDIDQVYNVQISDDNVAESLYVYAVSHELTLEHGRMTRLKLCRLGTIVAYSAIAQGATA